MTQCIRDASCHGKVPLLAALMLGSACRLNIGFCSVSLSACPTSSEESWRDHQFQVGGVLSSPPKYEALEGAFGLPVVLLLVSLARDASSSTSPGPRFWMLGGLPGTPFWSCFWVVLCIGVLIRSRASLLVTLLKCRE
jgi:hypothetical protein